LKKCLKNAQIDIMLRNLQPLLSRRDKLGYIAARNYRVLSDSLVEFEAFKGGLINKYGEPDKDENGVELGTVSLKIESPNFKLFCDEMAPLNVIEQEVEIMTARYEDAIGSLSGEELLGVDWMFED